MENQLIIKDKALMAMYQENLDAGTEDAGEAGVYPMVKITAGLSKENILANGKKSEIGKLYHTELKQDFDSIPANICYVGKFMLPDFNTKELKQTYVVGAVMEDNSPFVMFIKGFSLQNMWQFLGEVGNIKKRYKLPMYPLKVVVESVQRPHEKFGNVDVFKLSIQRTEDGVPNLEIDINRAQSLKALTEKFKEVVTNMTRKEEELDEYVDQANRQDYDPGLETEATQMMQAIDTEDVADQIPF